jgi:ribose-phosphate pyrophosphokinase
MPLDHLYSAMVMTDLIHEKHIPDLVLVAPDLGGTNLARAYAKRLDAPLALIDKRRSMHNAVEEMKVVGEVRGKNCLLVDDLCDTAGTLALAAEKLKEAGALKVYACFTHGVLSGNAVEKLQKAPLEEIFMTNTIPLSGEKKLEKFVTVSIAKLFAEAIKGIHHDESISTLFK